MSSVFYFGCWGAVGHYLWTPDRRWVRSAGPFADRDLDTPFCPSMTPDTRGRTPTDQLEGVAALHHRDGWTVLSFWDRSVDSRGGSHSTYVLEGTHAFDDAVRLAREAFPAVWARYSFDVREGSR